MSTYVVLYKFTDAGAKNVKGTVQRANESRAENERRGFKVHGLYWTQGQYDMVAVVEAPDEQAMLAGLFNIASAGNVRSETLRAFTEAEMGAVIQKMEG
ncbi:MAG TPA: GYD domain-containing protein [Roseiflexaceae bacterium]|nr:GYD domain-containing protein [Roseiflexaceae bacterium]